MKYDREIPFEREEGGLIKGFYKDDLHIVNKLKQAVAPGWKGRSDFKTIECAIMDVADDIAYSTYDLEDSLKAKFLTPASILASSDNLLNRVAVKVGKAIKKDVTKAQILEVLYDLFSGLAEPDEMETKGPSALDLYSIVRSFERSERLAADGYLRTDLTSELVGEFINSITVEVNKDYPCLSKLALSDSCLLKVETLKNFTFEATIFSTRLKVAEFRGYEVVSKIFDALAGNRGYLLMPDDIREMYLDFQHNATATRRLICDFVAGMTDRYALEFYARLHSDNPQSIFKPI